MNWGKFTNTDLGVDNKHTIRARSKELIISATVLHHILSNLIDSTALANRS